MSKCVYKNIADNLNKDELEKYYLTHTNKDVAEHFNFNEIYLNRILHYLDIKVGTTERYSYINKNYVCTEERNIKIKDKHIGKKRNSDFCQKMKSINQGRKITWNDKISDTLKHKYQSGDIVVWNKNKQGLQKWTSEQYTKYFDTLRTNHSFRTSKPEEQLYEALKFIYGQNNVIRQYSDTRYPFRCDFYIKSEDLFIELNRFWSHGGRLYDPNDDFCKNQ